jgi:protein-S-isoprenylcysteine O-methyltransferase Ste14
VRHPIYTGWILGTVGLEVAAQSSVGVGVAIALLVFFDLKSREEEKWLVATYADYPAYARQVKRFVPFVY